MSARFLERAILALTLTALLLGAVPRLNRAINRASAQLQGQLP
jgi:hypothetical protein